MVSFSGLYKKLHDSLYSLYYVYRKFVGKIFYSWIWLSRSMEELCYTLLSTSLKILKKDTVDKWQITQYQQGCVYTLQVYLTYIFISLRSLFITLQVWKISSIVTGLYFAAFAFYSLREDDWGGSTDHSTSRTSLHLRVDFLVFFLHGLLAYCFPGMIATFQVLNFVYEFHHLINAWTSVK